MSEITNTGDPDPTGQSMAKFFTRHDWGAVTPKWTDPLRVPVSRVVTTWAGVDPCSTEEECKQRVRNLQAEQMKDDRLADIRHNFMIGGDGNIYEGRGWTTAAPAYPPTLQNADEVSGRSVEIAFLDKHSKPSEILMKTSTDCIAFGLIGNYLKEKLLFFWKTPTKLEYLSSYETNPPGKSNPDNFETPNYEGLPQDREEQEKIGREVEDVKATQAVFNK